MEQVFKILKQLMGTAGALGTIPKPIRLAMTYFGVAIGVMLIFKFAKLGQTEKTFLIIACIVLVLITAGYYAWKAWMEKQHNRQFGGEISQHSSATPRALSDPGQRARLDDMRKKFQTGIDAYKSRGKDLYKLPWYVIVGEPGSGKTEAIRHSNIGFPPGMQDEFQGVGGTINMNWWFTSHAVLLDTAGRLMFEEVGPGETSEWKEFLGLLKKNRPNCPINGLFLVIPADSLIKDSAESIQKKAGKIAQQLDVIQRVLDVRFPVFVAITKCDKLNGFREFFDGLSDPQLQHQMMGWSNPAPLDQPFQPELVEKHLDQVATRLRRRRLGLLRDPVPENPDDRRTDEVDSLYALPHNLELLGSRLRRYLETIFVAGEWSAKPLFLRGIYFSSAMREGSALDAELAEAIGMAVEDLPEGKVWERERAYFLRDLFIDKIFREKGLVTRASNTKRMLRNQQVALYGFGFGALALFALMAWFAMGKLRGGVKGQGDYWHVVSTAGWQNKYWRQSIVPLRGDGQFAMTLSTNTVVVDGKPLSLGEFHWQLRDLAEKPLKRNLFFPRLAGTFNENSRKAQRTVFEAGVLRPLIDATRQKMSRDEGDPASAAHQPDALAALIQLESDILTRGTGTHTGAITPEAARQFLGALQNYIVAREVPVDTNYVAVMVRTYSTLDPAKGSWAPHWLSGGRGGTNTLAANQGISSGLDLFVRNATNGVQEYRRHWDTLSSLAEAARVFAKSETEFLEGLESAPEGKFPDAYAAVEQARRTLDERLEKVAQEPFFGSTSTLTNLNDKLRNAITSSAAAALERVRKVNNEALAVHKAEPLFVQIKERLDTVETRLSDHVAQLLSTGNPAEFQQLDLEHLEGKAYARRADVYGRAAKMAMERPFEGQLIVGTHGDLLKKFFGGTATLRDEAAGYNGKLKDKFQQAVGLCLKRVTNAQSRAFFGAYMIEAKSFLAKSGGFPLVTNTARVMLRDDLGKAEKYLEYMVGDFASPEFKVFAPRQPDWEGFVNTVKGQHQIASVLLGNGGFSKASIFLQGNTDATREKDAWRGQWRDIKLNSDAGSHGVRTSSEMDEKFGDIPVSQNVELMIFINANDPGARKQAIPVGEWGPVRLIHKHGKRDSDGKSWQVEMPTGLADAPGLVRLKVVFEGVLPELSDWPLQ